MKKSQLSIIVVLLVAIICLQVVILQNTPNVRAVVGRLENRMQHWAKKNAENLIVLAGHMDNVRSQAEANAKAIQERLDAIERK